MWLPFKSTPAKPYRGDLLDRVRWMRKNLSGVAYSFVGGQPEMTGLADLRHALYELEIRLEKEAAQQEKGDER